MQFHTPHFELRLQRELDEGGIVEDEMRVIGDIELRLKRGSHALDWLDLMTFRCRLKVNGPS